MDFRMFARIHVEFVRVATSTEGLRRTLGAVDEAVKASSTRLARTFSDFGGGMDPEGTSAGGPHQRELDHWA
jgi:hypothetical protein